MKKFVCVGYPDEENAHSGFHPTREEWECEANNESEAFRKAINHFYYFHEVGVFEKQG